MTDENQPSDGYDDLLDFPERRREPAAPTQVDGAEELARNELGADELAYWQDQARSLRRDMLNTVGRSANAAQVVSGVLLALVSTAAFAGGLDTIDDLPEWEAPWLKLATLVAGVMLATATVILNMAAGGLKLDGPEPPTGPDLMDLYEVQVHQKYRLLSIGRPMSYIAASIIAVGAAIVLIQDPSATSVAVTINGKVVCGDLEIGAIGIVVDGQELSSGVTEVVPVQRCPK